MIEARDAGSPAKLKDISTIGLCCSFPEPIPEMTLVRVQLEIDDVRHALDGAVVRCDRAGDDWEVAVYFTEVADAAREGIDGFIQANVPRAAEA